MKYLKDWLERLKSRPASGDYWEDHRHHEALQALAACNGESDWLSLGSHRNGFVREAAVRALSEQPSPAALATLLERTNDWVAQVRKLASAGVQRYLTPEHTSALLHALPQLMALAERQRADHARTLAAARTALQASEVRSEVVTDFLARRGKAARFLFAVLHEASPEPAALLQMALTHREMTVRQMAVSACRNLPVEQAVPLLLHALATPGASVRVKALHALLTRLDDPRDRLRDALLDASPAVRNLARWAAPRWQIDAHEVLQARLERALPKHKREWLGVLGLANDLEVTLDQPWRSAALGSAMSSVRLAALVNLGDAHYGDLLTMLDDPSDKVFSQAVEGLDRQPWAMLAPELDARLDRDWYLLPATRRTALMRLRPCWQQLAYLLRRLDMANEDRNTWLDLIAQRCGRRYLMPDSSTAKTEQAHLIERVRELENNGALPRGCAANLS